MLLNVKTPMSPNKSMRVTPSEYGERKEKLSESWPPAPPERTR